MNFDFGIWRPSSIAANLLLAAASLARAAGPLDALAMPQPIPQQPIPLMESALLRMTNDARSQQGLAALRWDEALARAARAHADLLAQNARLSHQFDGEPALALRAAQAGAHFQSVAENVAEGPGVESIQREWMNSPPHRANILDPALNSVGLAVVARGGQLYAVADFDRSVAALSYEQAEAQVEKLLSARGIQVSGPRLDARQTCEMSHGTAGGSNPGFVMRWQSADLSRLPAPLEERLVAGQYRTAAVGACDSADAASGFTTYRIAVLLY